jgi:hypothetical protein
MAEEERPEIEPNLTKEELAFAMMMAEHINNDPVYQQILIRAINALNALFIYLSQNGLDNANVFDFFSFNHPQGLSGEPKLIYQVEKFWEHPRPKGVDE